MYDSKLVQEILSQIYISSEKILKRFEPIAGVDDFTGSDTGMEKLEKSHGHARYYQPPLF
ncbi:MAG: hypothetical protein ABIK15_16580 [Pseudomonadota bacterium]